MDKAYILMVQNPKGAKRQIGSFPQTSPRHDYDESPASCKTSVHSQACMFIEDAVS